MDRGASDSHVGRELCPKAVQSSSSVRSPLTWGRVPAFVVCATSNPCLCSGEICSSLYWELWWAGTFSHPAWPAEGKTWRELFTMLMAICPVLTFRAARGFIILCLSQKTDHQPTCWRQGKPHGPVFWD